MSGVTALTMFWFRHKLNGGAAAVRYRLTKNGLSYGIGRPRAGMILKWRLTRNSNASAGRGGRWLGFYHRQSCQVALCSFAGGYARTFQLSQLIVLFHWAGSVVQARSRRAARMLRLVQSCCRAGAYVERGRSPSIPGAWRAHCSV
jgi:hypothetical protein